MSCTGVTGSPEVGVSGAVLSERLSRGSHSRKETNTVVDLAGHCSLQGQKIWTLWLHAGGEINPFVKY